MEKILMGDLNRLNTIWRSASYAVQPVTYLFIIVFAEAGCAIIFYDH
jgi:hypothetical protein